MSARGRSKSRTRKSQPTTKITKQTPMFDYLSKIPWKRITLGVFMASTILLGVENYTRKHEQYSEQWFRPSVGLEIAAIKAQIFFANCGWWLGQITDVFYWIYEYLAEDLINILRPLGKLAFSWAKFFKGYFDYYLSDITWTDWRFGMIGTLGTIIGLGFISRHFYGYPKMTGVISTFKWIKAQDE